MQQNLPCRVFRCSILALVHLGERSVAVLLAFLIGFCYSIVLCCVPIALLGLVLLFP